MVRLGKYSVHEDHFSDFKKSAKDIFGSNLFSVEHTLDPTKPLAEQSRVTRSSIFEEFFAAKNASEGVNKHSAIRYREDILAPLIAKGRGIPATEENVNKIIGELFADQNNFTMQEMQYQRGSALFNPHAYREVGEVGKSGIEALDQSMGTIPWSEPFSIEMEGQAAALPDSVTPGMRRGPQSLREMDQLIDRTVDGVERSYLKESPYRRLHDQYGGYTHFRPEVAEVKGLNKETLDLHYYLTNSAGVQETRKLGVVPKGYFSVAEADELLRHAPGISKAIESIEGGDVAREISFKMASDSRGSIPSALGADALVIHATGPKGREHLHGVMDVVENYLSGSDFSVLNREIGLDFDLRKFDPETQQFIPDGRISKSYSGLVQLAEKIQSGNIDLAGLNENDRHVASVLEDVFGIKKLEGNLLDTIDPESALGKDLARLGILDDLGVTPGVIPTPASATPGSQAAAKELRGPELQQQQLEARKDATARREAEYRRRQLPHSDAAQKEAVRERKLPHSDAAIKHLAERKETEKWQRQVRLELEGKSEPKLTLFEYGEHYDKTTDDYDKNVHKKRFHDEMRRQANIAPEELMFERAEIAKESKIYKEGLDRKNVHKKINARAATKTIEASQTRHEKLNRGKSRPGPRPADTAAPTVKSRIESTPPTIRSNPPPAPRRSSRGHLDFYLDVEASDIGFSHRDKVIKNKRTLEIGRGHSIPGTEGQRLHQKTVGTQILQFYGGTAEQIRDKDQKDVFHKHMELDVDAGIKKKLDASLKFDLLKTDGTLDRSFNTEEIDRIMTGTDLSVDEQKARKAMSNPAGPQGKFKITNPAVLKSITASRLTNPTAGMFGLGVNLTNHTLNQVLGRSVFESKYGRPNATSSEQFVQEFLNRMVKLEKTASGAGKQARVVAWNMNYDLTKIAEQVDIYGKNIRVNFKGKEETAAKVFQDLFIGSDPNQANYLIKSVDAADRLKDMHLWRLIHDNSYNLHSINHKNVAEKLKSGSRTRREIKRAAIEELKSYKTGAKTEFIKTNTALKEFAGDISKYKNSELDENALRNEFYDRITRDQPEFSSADMSRHRKGRVGKVVNQAVKLVKEVSEVDHASGDSMMETVRRNVAALDNIDSTGSILNKIWKITDKTSGIMGFGLNKDIEYAAEGSQTKKTLMSMGRLATGHDTVAGYSISAGDGGSLGSFIAAKADYIELHGKPSEGTGLHDVFKTIDDIRKEAHGAAHDASVDTRQMVNQSLNLLDNEYFRGSHGEDTSIQEFRGRYLQYRQEESIKGGIDAYIFEEDFRPSGKGAAGVNILEDIIPEPQTIANAGDAPARELIDSTEPLAPRSRGIKGRGGVLAGGVLALAGLALIGNRNGGIKHPGSRYNTVEGISPSGDPLIHSFGSGSDNFSSQAITNLKYGTGYGSNTLRSSMLGYRGDRLRDILLGRSSFDDYTNSSEKGTLVHNIIEAEYLKRDIAQSSEHVVHSPELDVMGHIDLVLNSGVPLEIKSVEDFEALERLKSPKEAHISQANFYAYALKQPYALIGYAARNDPTAKIKYFKVNTNIKRLRNDVEAVRAMMSDLQRQGYDVQNYSAYQAMRDVYARATQNKYQQNAVGMGAGLPSGMMAPPEYSAIKGLGDYGKHIRSRVYRQENRTNLTSTQQFKSKSRIRDQGKHAALHGNSALKYNTRTSHPNRSRQMV